MNVHVRTSPCPTGLHHTNPNSIPIPKNYIHGIQLKNYTDLLESLGNIKIESSGLSLRNLSTSNLHFLAKSELDL